MNKKFFSLPKKMEGKGKSREVLHSAYLWIPLTAAIVTIIIELFNHKAFATGLSSFWSFVTQGPLALLVNFLLVLITLAPAFFLRRRLFYGTLVSAVWLIGGGVNGFILLNRMTPFTTADLTVFNTGIDTLPNYMSTFNIILLVVTLVVLLALLVFLFIKGPRNQQSGRRRVITGLVAMIICGGALVGGWAAAFRTNQLSTVFANLAYAYEDYGFSYCFLQTWLNTGVRRPDNYDSEMMDRLLTQIQENTPETDPQDDVNVIIVQLESFIPPSEIKGLELSEDATPTWHALEKAFTSGYITVPVVGAGTANTENEILTGMSTRYFGPGEYPFKTCLSEQTTESIAWDLKNLGYGTHAIHNHRATFYGRKVVYSNLGFDDFTSLEFMPRVTRTPQNWAKDYILTSQILSALDSTEDQSDLVFTVSVQGHGSYPTVSVLENPAVTVTEHPNYLNEYSMEYYVNQMREMDLFIKNLVQQLSDREEKTMLVLYGDHLPAMNGLERQDMKGGSLYKTRYIIWNNFGLEKKDKNLNAYELSSYALGQLDITQGLINSFHQFCSGESNYRNDLKAIQYDMLYGEQYLWGGENPYEATDMQLGMYDITVTGLYQRQDNWYVRGTHFSPYCDVTVNGKRLSTTYISDSLLRINEDPGTTNYEDLGIQVVDMHEEILQEVPSITQKKEGKAEQDG